MARRRYDLVLATVVAALACAEMLHRGHQDAVTLITSVVAGAALLAHRDRPALMVVLYLTALLGRTALVGGTDSEVVIAVQLGVAFLLGVDAPGRRGVALLALLGAGYLLDAVLVDSALVAGVYGALGLLALLAAPFAGGRVLGRWRAQTAELRARTQQLEREREERARMAVVAERHRVGRRLYAMLGTSLRDMVAWAEAGRGAVGHDTAGAEAAFAAIQRDGRTALGEMRALLGVLRAEGDERPTAPPPSIHDLERLVARAREAGLLVTIEAVDAPGPLPAAVDLAAYRILREALSAVAERRPVGAVRLRVTTGAGALELELAGAALGEVDWRPLADRVRLYGGELERRRGAENAVVVTAHLPLEVARA